MGTVTGKVTLDGKPHANAVVSFNSDAGSATGTTDANGQYELAYTDKKGAPVGHYKVSVTTMPPATSGPDISQLPSDSPEYAKAIASGGNYKTDWKEPIPAKFNTQTTIEKDVKAGSNVIDIELTSS
jgi:hypothetical protein